MNAQLKVQVEAADYASQVEQMLSDYRKKANIPGFRPGKVPMGMVRKMYGKSVLIEEVNKVLQKSIYDFIAKEELNLLGNPLPLDSDIDWENQKDFDFTFEIGLSPEFEFKITAKDKLTNYRVVADDKMLNEYVDDIRRRYGKL